MHLSTPGRSRLSRWLHNSFELILMLQGLLGLSQLIAGLGLFLSPTGAVLKLAEWLTHTELAQDPVDPFAHWVLTLAQGFSIQTESFAALYLVAHGVLNLGLAVSLAARIRTAYPASMVILAGFIAVQMDRYIMTHSPMMLFLSAFDLVVIALAWREYRQIRRGKHQAFTPAPDQERAQ